jgi:hypothetical protein
VGKYKGAKTGTMVVERDNGVLNLVIDKNRFIIHPSSDNVFFSMDRDLEFEFVKNPGKNVTGLIVRENGEVVEKAEAIK